MYSSYINKYDTIIVINNFNSNYNTYHIIIYYNIQTKSNDMVYCMFCYCIIFFITDIIITLYKVP